MKNVLPETTRRKPLSVVQPRNATRSISKAQPSILSKKSLLGSQEPLEFSHPQISFIEVEVDQSYEIQLLVKNVTAACRRIKIIKPNDNRFEVSEIKDSPLAPGLSLKISVFYFSKQVLELHTSLKILSEDDYQRDIPINVYPPSPCLIFQPFINFGYVRQGKPKTQQIEVANQGTVGTQFSFDCQSPDVSIQPKKIYLEPKAKTRLSITLLSSTIGPLETFINILPKQRVLSQIQVSATTIQFSRFLINQQGKEIEQLDAKSVLVGESYEIAIFLINNTPKISTYRISQKKGSETKDLPNTTPEEVGRQDTQRILYFNPTQGKMEPYSQNRINFKIVGKLKHTFEEMFLNYALGKTQEEEELEHRWKYLVTFHYDEDQKDQTKLNISGVCIIPRVRLSTNILDFGQVHVGQNQSQTISFHNSSQSPITISFPKSKNFSFSPSKVKVQQQSSLDLTVTFNPKKNGDLSEVYMIQVGYFKLPLKLFGQGKFNAHPNHQNHSTIETQRYSATLDISHISKGMQPSAYIDMSRMGISQIDQSILPNQKQQTLKLLRKQRLQKMKEEEVKKLSNTSKCRQYDESKPFDYEFDNRINAPLQQSQIQLEANKDPLFLDKRLTKMASIKQPANPNATQPQFDPFKPVQEYPPTCRNQNQQRIVSRQLQPDELRQVQVGPTTIHIDNIFLNSSRQATFHIVNNNKIPISIQMLSNQQELSGSCKNIQILPSNSSGGLKIHFKALRIGQFKFPVKYILNGRHFFDFTLNGNVILPTLSLNRNQLRFLFQDDDKDFSKVQRVSLKNNYDYDARFKWVMSKDGIFQVLPQQGIVGPHSQLTVSVKYNANVSNKQFQLQSRTDEDKLRLRVLDGNQTLLKCVSQVVQSVCQCKPTDLNFKDISVCKNAQQKFIVKNVGRAPTVFKVQLPTQLQGTVQVSPQKKHLAIDQACQVSVRVLSMKSGLIDSSLTVQIRCGKSVIIPIKGNIILPKVYVQEDNIDFGSTPKSGTPAQKLITIVNESVIAAELELNLGSTDGFLYRCLQIQMPNKSQQQNLIITSSKPRDTKLSKPNNYHLRILPKSQSKLLLRFIPQEIRVYDFYLPLGIAGLPDDLPELKKLAVCKGITNKLMIDPKQIDFKRVIIQSEKGLCKYQEVHLTNPTDQELQWWIGNDDISPFSLESTKGVIKPFETVSVKLTFYPSTRGEYAKQIGFFINQPEMQLTSCYISINVKACSDFPCIIFDRPYLLMPTVPLNVQSRAYFEIFNDGYQNLNIKHIVVQEMSNIDLRLSYPNGPNLGITKKKIKVEACFKHEKPLSFTLNVEFYDDSNRVYTLPISGTTDNCMYTIQDFFQEQQSSETIEQQCDYLRRYINTHICMDKQVNKFPQNLLENDMELLLQVLTFYSCSFDRMKSTKKTQNISTVFSILDQIIRILKSEGALLNHIRPQLLLNYYDCISYFKSIESAEKYYQIPWLEGEEDYQILQKKSWIVLIYQILRTYNIYRVGNTTKPIKGKTPPQNTTTNSLKFSNQQKLLISWVDGIYNNHESRLDPKSVEDFTNLSDCEILATLLHKFTNIKMLDSYGKSGLTKKDVQKRCSKFVENLSNLGITTHIQAQDIEKSIHRQMLPLIQQLYQVLPNYLPKGPPVQFTCSLGQSITKVIEISNPSKHTVSYWAKIEGSKDFQPESQPTFLIEPKRSIEFKIRYMSHFSNTSQATVTFIGKKDNKSIPATMVFTLKGQTVGRVSEKCVQVTSYLYEQIEFNVNVVNNLAADGDFKVQLLPDKNIKLSSFFCFTQKLKVRKTSTNTLSVTFMPMTLETQRYYLMFSDPLVGEFQYELVGLVEMPLVSNDILRIPAQIFVDTQTTVDVTIPHKNDLMSKARKQLETLAETKGSKIPKGQQIYPKLTSQPYSIEITPVTEMISCSREVYLNFGEQEDTYSASGVSRKDDNRKVALNINMKVAIKQGVVLMTLKNASKTDIRRYKLILNVTNKPFKYIMEIKTNLFKQIVQPIPMINPTQQPNIYTIQLTQDKNCAFTIDCEKEMTVDPSKTEHTNLTFKPRTTGHFQACLKMQNITVGQLIEYELVGISQEPEAIELNYRQNAKESKSYDIKLNNPSNIPLRYAVKMDLQYAVGAQGIIVPPFSSVNYNLTLSPKYIGIYSGSIVFDEEGRYIAYKVTVDTRETLPIKQFSLSCKERVPTMLDMEVEQGLWNVSSTDSCLSGEEKFLSKPGNKYKMIYLSGRRNNSKISVYFHNAQKGDFAYLVNIQVSEAPETKLNTFKAELGKAHMEPIELQNLEPTRVKVTAKSSNPGTFAIEPSVFYINPKSRTKVNFVYTPSNLQIETADIVFQSQLGERWRYSVSGIGILPSYEEKKIIEGQVNKDTSTFLNFRNPFKEKIQVIVSIDGKTALDNQVFKLIMKNKRVEIEPLGLLSIPIVFIPKHNEKYETTLQVYMNERMSWKFSIIGVVTTKCQAVHKIIKFKCREKKVQKIAYVLPQLPSDILEEYNSFSLKLTDVSPASMVELVQKSLILVSGPVTLENLSFGCELLSYRPFQAHCTFQVQQANMCKWQSQIEVICQEPEPDDQITIISDVGSSSSVSFKLTNRIKAFAKFNAYFTPQSDVEFSVSPKTGDLQPYSKEGTMFTLTFNPLEYGKPRSGKLIIETEDSYWSYVVKGVLPHYSPPKGVSILASRLH